LPEGVELARVWRRREPDELRGRLSEGPLVVWGEDDVLHVLWQGPKARLVAGVQLPMWPVEGADDLWELSVRIRRLDAAVIGVVALPVDGAGGQPVERIWHGPRAQPAPPAAEPLAGSLTERTVDSENLGGPRDITVYRPPGPPGPMPLCLLADGQVVPEHARILEPAITSGALPPVMLVGLHSDTTSGHYPDGRSREYLPEIDPPRFDAHLDFAVAEILPAFPEATHVITAGFSNGASFALAAADRRPDLITAALALSPNLPPPQLDTGVRIPRYVAAGTLEGSPGFRECARLLAAAMAGAGIRHRHEEWIGGHDPYWWRVHLVAGLTWLVRDALPSGI
jgi:enterochelin esterase-like enzyme